MIKKGHEFVLPELPYPIEALEPHISSKTLSYHHGKHHDTYIKNLNNLIKDTDLAQASLEDIIMQSSSSASSVAIFNNAAQCWNHDFYWKCMSPGGGGKPKNNIMELIDRDFGSYDNFVIEFSKAALAQFGSGWAWLVWDKKTSTLLITKTGNADLPMIHNQVALLTIDVWEHAYYLDHQNRRAEYVKSFIDHLMNWRFAEGNLAMCMKN